MIPPSPRETCRQMAPPSGKAVRQSNSKTDRQVLVGLPAPDWSYQSQVNDDVIEEPQ